MEENQLSPKNTIPTPSEVMKGRKINKTFFLVAGLVILTAVLLIISLTTRKDSPPSVSNKNVQTDYAHTSLSISEEPRQASVAGTYETDVNIDSKDNLVTGAQIELSYDPASLTNVEIKPGNFLPKAITIKKTIDAKKGTITFWLWASQGAIGVKGTGAIATITFTKTDTLETTISFLPESLVSDERYDQSVLKETTSGVIGPLSL